MAFRFWVASTSDWPPDRNCIPGFFVYHHRKTIKRSEHHLQFLANMYTERETF
uniref:Uncharacterized protein n=1 Tax=Arundo donax TaxID=35708 RepID=A0A0A9FRC9_ARUDO